MKKLSALLLAFAMIFMSACSQGDSDTTSADESIDPVSESETEKYNTITEWGTDLLPDKFPSPPKGTHDFSIASNESTADNSVRLTFICSEQEFYSFTNEMTLLGYKGNARNVRNGSYYIDGFNGYWQNGETYVRINDATATDNGEIIFQIDVADCVDNFPKALEKYFPKFDGYSINTGTFCGHDGNGERITDEFEGSFAMAAWHWDFRFSNCFVGVEQSEFEDYFFEIEEEGYEGVISTSSLDGFTVMSGDLTKDNYGVFMLYNTSLKTLDIAYTNDISIYIEQ